MYCIYANRMDDFSLVFILLLFESASLRYLCIADGNLLVVVMFFSLFFIFLSVALAFFFIHLLIFQNLRSTHDDILIQLQWCGC